MVFILLANNSPFRLVFYIAWRSFYWASSSMRHRIASELRLKNRLYPWEPAAYPFLENPPLLLLLSRGEFQWFPFLAFGQMVKKKYKKDWEIILIPAGSNRRNRIRNATVLEIELQIPTGHFRLILRYVMGKKGIKPLARRGDWNWEIYLMDRWDERRERVVTLPNDYLSSDWNLFPTFVSRMWGKDEKKALKSF